MALVFDLGFARGTRIISTEISASRWLEIFHSWLRDVSVDSVENTRESYGGKYLIDAFGDEFGSDAAEAVRKQLMWN